MDFSAKGEQDAHCCETFTEASLRERRKRRTPLHPGRQLDKITLDERGDRLLQNPLEVLNQITESKPIIDEIDRVLAARYGFADEELDFIPSTKLLRAGINYDINYRMGRDAETDDPQEDADQ